MNNVKYQPRTIKCRNYKNYDVDAINNDLLKKDWNRVYRTTSASKALNYFLSVLKETLDEYAPFIVKQIKGKPSPWITKNLSKEMNNRDQLLRKARRTNKAVDWDTFKRKRNFVKNEVQRLKRNYYKSKLKENATKPEKFWKVINEIYSTKSNREDVPKSFNVDGKLIYESEGIANGFCKFFSTIAKKLKVKTFPLTNMVWKSKNSSVYFEKHQFSFKDVNDVEVLKYLRKLKRNSAVGLDQIPSSFLKDTAFVIAKPLTHIINCSLRNGEFPNTLARAKVTPIFKSGSKQLFDNYRPISVLPAISKIFEKCVHSQIMNHLESSKLLSIQQFGYRKKRSTDLATVYFIDEIRRAMDKGMLTGAIYIDLSKAFDTIGHNAILEKLPQFGITGIPQEWFCSYLFSRYQQVSYKQSLSTAEPIYCGVPQGSILGPLLFLLHFNDASTILKKCKIVKYADDTVLFYCHKDKNEIEYVLNHDFRIFCEWLERNELIVNTKKGKTEAMIFGTSQRLARCTDTMLHIERNFDKISNTNSYKYLGVKLNCSLNMSEHIESSIKKAASRINLLKSMRNLVDSDVSAKIYCTMILPILSQSPFIICGTVSTTLQNKIKSVERRAQKIIGYSPLIPSSMDIQRKRVATFVHRVLQGNDVCENFENYFSLNKTGVCTRNNNIMARLPYVKLEAARKSFYFQGAKIYNELPREIRSETSHLKFKSLLKSL